MSNKITYCAEIGSSHCGSLELALAHIKAAQGAGATAVKFQLFRAETLDARPEMQEMLRPYELPLPWLKVLSVESREAGLLFGVTPFAVDLVEPLRGLVDFVKISAYDLTFDDLITAAAGLGVPVVLSTAMATHAEILHAASLSLTNAETILLHGVAQYPTTLEDQNLGIFNEWMGAYGLSDHTRGHEAAMLAVALGATWIEKHFRLSPLDMADAVGIDKVRNPDYEVSADPMDFALMVGACERARHALGNGEKNGPLDCERELYETCRRSNTKRRRG